MTRYEELKNKYPLRRDIILIIVLLLLILTAIIFPRFKVIGDPVEKTEIIYIEPEKKIPPVGGDPTPGPDIVGSLLKEMDEKPIPPELIPDSVDFEPSALDTFDTLLNKAMKEMSPKPPQFPMPKRNDLTPEEIWEIYYKEIVKRDPNAEPELGFNLSGYGGPYLEWGCQDYDTPPSIQGGLLTLYSGNLDYPINMLKEKIEDTVKVVIFVEANGTLSLVRLLEPAKHKDFELAAIIAVAKSKWEPGQKDGMNVPVAYVYQVAFNRYNQTLVTTTIYNELQSRRHGMLVDPPILFPCPVGGYKTLYDRLVYPQAEYNAGIEGKVYIYVFVEPDSSISRIAISESSGYDALDQAAIEALQDLKFIPFHLDSVNIGLWTPVWVRFKLNK